MPRNRFACDVYVEDEDIDTVRVRKVLIPHTDAIRHISIALRSRGGINFRHIVVAQHQARTLGHALLAAAAEFP